MNIKQHYIIFEIETIDGDYRRIYDKLKSTLIWENDYKQYVYIGEGNWSVYSKKRNRKKIESSCWLEDDYQIYLRKEKFKRLIQDGKD